MKRLFALAVVAMLGMGMPALLAQEAGGPAPEPRETTHLDSSRPSATSEAPHAPPQAAPHAGSPADSHAPSAEAAHGTTTHGNAAQGAAAQGGAHVAGPVVPKPDRRWAVLVFLILVMFFMAAVIGPIVRAHAPVELPATHSHDEPPGASHHHGHTGTINPVPHDVARVEQGEGHGITHGHH